MKTLVLIDGEHYPPVTHDAVKSIKDPVVAAVFLGGTEKIGDIKELVDKLKIPVHQTDAQRFSDIITLIVNVCRQYKIEKVIDLSDEPIVNYNSRFQIASALMREQVQYTGSDFEFSPPSHLHILTCPSLAVTGTTKRVGKTAISGFVARTLKIHGYTPCIVTMGRGGPAEPETIRGDTIKLSPSFLLEQADKGKHAASDHWENAAISQVVTVGCRRCGGGMAGTPFVSNVAKGAEIANDVNADFVIMEGSGITLPPVHTDGHIVIIGAHQPIEFIKKYFGPFRVRISDLVILMMCEEPMASQEKVKTMAETIDNINPGIPQAHCVFRPEPLGSLTGKKVALTTTAPPSILDRTIIPYMEETFDCTIVGASPHLSHRPHLKKDLKKFLSSADTLVTEIKASGIDVATREAVANEIDVVYLNNVPKIVGGTVQNLEKEIVQLAREVAS
ncbi:MAG: 2,3-diphosphoglycerate synthetase [Candidatus Methanofastidiosia archaeon]|jgi:cyclic 2,3-diphosphoglycerate synthetase